MKYVASKRKEFFLRMIFFLLCEHSFAQLSISPNNTATSLAQTLAGAGVTISNATLNCGGSASGTFSYSGSNLGLSGGILLTTGVATQIANSGNYLCNVNNGNNYNDPDLTAVVPSADLDACILEFDFIPVCDTLKMQFVFGSEEYPQGVSASYDDAFAIFLTGPNPTGGSYSAQNIATLPNGTVVSIDNVNAGTNAQYFDNNYTSPNSDIAYNGYTNPITSITPVLPCNSYHIKFAIADAGNALYDSGVLISNNTLSCETSPTITVNTTATSGCNNTGSATVTVTNYTGITTYQWVPGNATTASVNNLASGTYTCYVTTYQACGTTTQTITATVGTTGGTIVLTSSQTNLICYNGSTASATVSAIGGTSPYNCVWNTSPPQNGLIATNLSAGTYTANIIDNGGCSASISITIPNPPAMQTTVNTTSTTCTGAIGTASVNVTANGTQPYTYSWNTNPIQTTQMATNLSAGNYTVLISDANTCTTTAVAIIPVQAINWSATATTTNVACYGEGSGQALVTINNGAGDSFTYNWNTTPTQNTQTATGLFAGNYSCLVTNGNSGCVVTVTLNIMQPSQLTAQTNTISALCTGSTGSATVTASGGTQPYSYLWNTSQTTSAIHNLSQNTYTATIVDANQCTVTTTAIVSVSNPNLQIQTSVINSVCGGPSGSVSVSSVTPSAPPFIYTWNPPGVNTSSIDNLFPGTYSLQITDANGCMGGTVTAVGTNTFFPIQINTSPDYCGKSIGSATAIPHANPPYQYIWNSNPPQTTQVATALPTGNYTVVVVDGYNTSCKDSVAVFVSNIPTLLIQTSVLPTYCDKNFGSAAATAFGYPPYQYIWNTGETTANINNLTIGNYVVQVSDSYSCTNTASVTITNINDSLIANIQTQPIGDIFSLSPIEINVNTNSGWNFDNGFLSNGDDLSSNTHYTFQQSGDYLATYVFTSTHGCIDTAKFTIHVIDYSTLYIPNAFTPNGDGKNDVFKAEGTFITNFEMDIFDRWGDLVIKLNNINASWNGTYKGQRAEEGVYVYKGVATDETHKQFTFKGQIVLIR